MIQFREDASKEAAMQTAKQMMAAAMTAPKGCGLDNIRGAIVTGEEKDILAGHMRDIAKETGEDFYARDARNVDGSYCVLLLWTEDAPIQLTNCGLCGCEDCADNRAKGVSCAFNVTDLGIAVGSAVAFAADNRVDSRVLFSAGKGAARMDIFGDEIKVCYGIPISISSKSIYFDRGEGDVEF